MIKVKLYKRSDSKKWYIHYSKEGKQFKKALNTDDKEEAYKIANEWEEVLNTDSREKLILKIIDAKKQDLGRVKIVDAWNMYIDEPERRAPSAETMKNNKHYWKEFAEWFADKGEFLDDVTKEHAKQYAVYLTAKNLSPNTFNYKKNFLKSFFAVLADAAGITTNPFSVIVSKKTVVAEYVEISESEVTEIISKSSNEDALLFALGAYAGCRLKDACLMPTSAIVLENKIIKFQPHKTKNRSSGKYVHLPIVDELYKCLEHYPISGKYLLPKWAESYTKEKATTVNRIKRLMLSTIPVNFKNKTSGVRGFHAFRHFFVNYCHKNNVPFSVVQGLVGHGSPAMTAHYTHVDIDSARRAFGVDESSSIQKIISLYKKLSPEGQKQVKTILD